VSRHLANGDIQPNGLLPDQGKLFVFREGEQLVVASWYPWARRLGHEARSGISNSGGNDGDNDG
jgi:hypothetical protein